MRRNNSSISLGLILILVGLGLTLHRMGLMHLTFDQIYPVVALAVGVFSAIAVARGDKNSVFWSGFLLMFGVATFLRNYDLVTVLWELETWSILMLCLGLSFFVIYLFKPNDWGVLIPGCILSFIGFIMVMDDLNFSWFTIDRIKSLWPIILIIIGAGIIASSFRKKSS
jgi:predicted tellurium resistance membrane protein TerC